MSVSRTDGATSADESLKTMTRTAVYARITEIEVRHDLLSHTVDGWCVWPLLRKAVADALTGDFANVARKTPRLRPMWGQALRDLAAVSILPRARLLAKTYVSGLLDETEDGRFRDIWFDDLLEAHPNALKIDAVNNRRFLGRRERSVIPSATTTTLLDLTSKALGRAFGTSPDVATVARKVDAVIRSEFGEIISPTAIVAVLNNFAWQRRLYSLILLRVRPEAILVIDFGEYALIAAAKGRDIPVLALQHGIADKIHATYAWTEYALSRRSQLPIADRFLLHGQYWFEELSSSLFWQNALDVVGSPRVDRYRAIARSSGDGPYRVLFTADGIEAAETVRVIQEFLIDAPALEVSVIIKLHPVYTALDGEFRAAFANEKRVCVRGATEGESTFRLLRTVDLHVSIASASHYDALGLGTPTAILAVGNYQPVEHLYLRGHASLLRNGSELLQVLQRARSSSLPKAVSDFYFRPGGVDNILAVLDRFIQSGSKAPV